MKNNAEIIEKVIDNVGEVIIGKKREIKDIMKGILAGGHILIEDVPGVGKTMLVKAINRSLDLSYNRIQFTPDLLPSDITGISVYNAATGRFQFEKGPVFSNILLADEINRTSPKTQSALLEVMEEMQVSDSGITYKIDKPFCIIATENPIEYEGTFSLPEAQLDRFMVKVSLGYPSMDDESRILSVYREEDPINFISPVLKKEDVIRLQQEVRLVKVRDDINSYIVNIMAATRSHKALRLGGSIRASLSLLRIAQASAMMEGRDFVIPEDVKKNAVLTLAHRLILTNAATAKGITSSNVMEDIMKNIDVPKVKIDG